MPASANNIAKRKPLIPTAQSVLGGPKVLPVDAASDQDWMRVVRAGIPGATVSSACEYTGWSLPEISASIAVAERTLHRRKNDRLTPEESEKMVRFARVVARAEDVFGDRAKALRWLKTENPALGHEIPINLVDTDIGGNSVLATLGRIEHGVFA